MDIFELYSFFLFGVVGVYLVMFLISIRNSDGPLSSVFSLICLASAVYVLGAAFQFNSQSVEEIVFSQKFKYFGVSFIPALWLVFAYIVYFRRKMSLGMVLFVFLIPALVLCLVSTNEYHGLYYSGMSVFQHGEYLFSRRTPGPLYYLHVSYAYFVVGFCMYSFFMGWVKGRFKLTNPYFLLFSGVLLSGILSGFYLLGMTPFRIDMMPVGYFVLALFSGIGIFKYKILEINEIYDKEIFSEIKEGLMLVSYDGILLDYNKSAQRVFGWLQEKNKGFPIHSLDSRFSVSAGARNFYINTGHGDEKRIYEFRLTELQETRKIGGYLYIFLDVTEKMRLIGKLRYMADHDSLTGAFNRGRILAEAKKILSAHKNKGRIFSLCMIDVDYFKEINDSYGHIAGNRMLCELVKAFSQVLDGKGMLGRYGGEEFLVILPDVVTAEAAEIAETLRGGIEAMTVPFGENTLSVTVSVGVTSTGLHPGEEETIDVLAGRADRALYRAKNTGRNRVCVFGEDGL